MQDNKNGQKTVWEDKPEATLQLHVGYALQAWSPHLKKDIKTLESLDIDNDYSTGDYVREDEIS